MFKIKRLQVYANTVALVFNNGILEDVLTAGKHWIGHNREVDAYSTLIRFNRDNDLDILLKNEKLASMLDILIVKDNEIAIQYKNGLFNQVLKAGRYAYWKDGIEYTYTLINMDHPEVDTEIDRKILSLPALLAHVRTHVVESFEIGLLHIDGEYVKNLKPGTYYFWRTEKVVSLLKADLRTQQIEINGQELLTKDKASIRINLTTTYRLTDVVKALVETNNSAKQLYSLMQMALREYIGQYTLDELLANKASATPYLLNFAKDKATALGYLLLTTGIKDIILPGDVKDIMNQVLVAEKKAQANVIMRREETASTRSLLNTAKLMQDNDMLYKLKEMEYVEKIADNIQNISLNGGGHLVDQLRGLFAGSEK